MPSQFLDMRMPSSKHFRVRICAEPVALQHERIQHFVPKISSGKKQYAGEKVGAVGWMYES